MEGPKLTRKQKKHVINVKCLSIFIHFLSQLLTILWQYSGSVGQSRGWCTQNAVISIRRGTYPLSVVFELPETTIVNRLRLGQIRIWFQAGAEGLPSVRNVQNRPGAHEAPYWTCTGFFPWRQSAWGVNSH